MGVGRLGQQVGRTTVWAEAETGQVEERPAGQRTGARFSLFHVKHHAGWPLLLSGPKFRWWAMWPCPMSPGRHAGWTARFGTGASDCVEFAVFGWRFRGGSVD